jgi:hypothetical protein
MRTWIVKANCDCAGFKEIRVHENPKGMECANCLKEFSHQKTED